MRFPTLALLAFVAGCGARVEPMPAEPATADTGSSASLTDAASGSAEASEASTPEFISPPSTWGGGPAITMLEACGSSESVDKIIAHTTAPLAPLPIPAPIDVIPGGTTCTVIDARSTTGEYAFSGKCGLVDKTASITVIVREGVTSADGRPMQPGKHIFFPTTSPGRLCGTAFVEVAF